MLVLVLVPMPVPMPVPVPVLYFLQLPVTTALNNVIELDYNESTNPIFYLARRPVRSK
jgi:hypothetical protein